MVPYLVSRDPMYEPFLCRVYIGVSNITRDPNQEAHTWNLRQYGFGLRSFEIQGAVGFGVSGMRTPNPKS